MMSTEEVPINSTPSLSADCPQVLVRGDRLRAREPSRFVPLPDSCPAGPATARSRGSNPRRTSTLIACPVVVAPAWRNLVTKHMSSIFPLLLPAHTFVIFYRRGIIRVGSVATRRGDVDSPRLAASPAASSPLRRISKQAHLQSGLSQIRAGLRKSLRNCTRPLLFTSTTTATTFSSPPPLLPPLAIALAAGGQQASRGCSTRRHRWRMRRACPDVASGHELLHCSL
jgi:hypothetical protein